MTATQTPCEGTRFAKVDGKETIQVCLLPEGHKSRHAFDAEGLAAAEARLAEVRAEQAARRTAQLFADTQAADDRFAF